MLRREPECVCHLGALLAKPQPYVSQQLRLIREAGVVADEKQGQNVFYRLADDEVRRWLDVVLGSPVDQYAASPGHKQVISCSCPKCTDQPLATPVAAAYA